MSHESHFPNGLSVDHTPGVGVKVGSSASQAFGWRDITGQILTRGVGATDPAWAQLSTGPFYAYRFDINDVAWIPFHVPHDIVPDADIHFHVHWIPDGTDANTVKWNFDYMYARGFNQDAFNPAGSSVTAEEAGPGTAWQHMVTETAAVSIANLDEPDGIIYLKLTRVTNGGTDNADDIFVLLSDLHYQCTNCGTANKAPTFYGT